MRVSRGGSVMNCACSGCLPLDGGFGRKITAARPLIAMHSVHGHGPEGKRCGECAHVVKHHQGNATFFKCHAYDGGRGSNTSDWRLKWEACGKFQADV